MSLFKSMLDLVLNLSDFFFTKERSQTVSNQNI